MLMFALDTSSALVSVALLGDNKKVFFKQQVLERGQGEVLFPMIQELLKSSDQYMMDLTGVAVAVGPGSFTGVRIALATARAIGLALNVPVYGVTNFEAVSFGLLKPVTVVLDSKRGDYFVQRFDEMGQSVDMPHIETEEQLKKTLPFTAAGDGALTLTKKIGCKVIDKISPSAVSVGRVALSRMDHPMPAVPLYLRDADVTV